MNQQLDIHGGRHDIAPAHETQKLFNSAQQIKGQTALDTDAWCDQATCPKSECVECNSEIRRALQSERRVELRTRYGNWRFVVAVYSDDTVGTIRAEGNSAGTWRVQDVSSFVEIREAEPPPGVRPDVVHVSSPGVKS